MQITNQIIMGIATSRLHEGDALPSVRQLASIAGINMHTVNKSICTAPAGRVCNHRQTEGCSDFH